MKVPVIVSSSISVRSSEFVIGHFFFVLVIHEGLFVFAFSIESHKCLKTWFQ